MPTSGDRIRVAVWLVCLCWLAVMFTGCSAPQRAPVVSRGAVTTNTASSRQVRPQEAPASYHVKRGDTLYSIAWRFGLDHRSVARWNGIRSPYTIFPGQRLRLKPVRYSRSSTVAKRSDSGASGGKSSITTANPPDSSAKKPRTIQKKTTPKRVETKFTPVLKLHWRWPTNGLVAQRFARGDIHRKGIKISGKPGVTIKAAEAGKIVYAGSGLIGYGRLVIIKHNKNYLSAYGYNQSILVKEGDTVKKGASIAKMGSDSDGKPMLHFEIRRNGAPVDPLKLLPRRS